MATIRALLTATTFFIIAGCASMKGTVYFVPDKVDGGWTQIINKKGFLEFGEIPPDLSYKCGKTTITFYSTALSTTGTFGPPLIPFPFPYLPESTPKETIPVYFKLESQNNNTKVLNAAVDSGNKKVEPIELISQELKDNSTSSFKYIYKLNWQEIENYIFNLTTSDLSCGVLSVPYSRQRHITYSMI